jgi:hypothetical protein
MNSAQVLSDAFSRVQQIVHRTATGCTAEQLAHRMTPDANSIGWLIWHLTRVEDSHLADAAGTDQLWTRDGWCDLFGLPFDPGASGYGFSSAQVGQTAVASADLLIGYFDAVYAALQAFLAGLSDDDLERIIDTSYDPPVTLGVRLVSFLSDSLQHAGQAAFVKGQLPA